MQTGARSDFGGKENQGRGGGQPGAVGEPGGGQVVLFHANSKQASPLETSVHPTGVPSTGLLQTVSVSDCVPPVALSIMNQCQHLP